MDILIRYWNAESKISETRYLDSQFLEGAKATQILETFINGVKDLDPNHLLQISSDGPNVNLKFLELIAEIETPMNFHLL